MTDQPDLFSYAALARTSDPATSHLAAKSLDLQLKQKHLDALAVIANCAHREDLTDDALSELLYEYKIVARHEQGRRIVRTLRENYGFLRFATVEGEPVVTANRSGRLAQVNELTETGRDFITMRGIV